ncbi:Histidine kinase-, DNA gyrase B-, and HSP90-like ATPase [Friedmanniella luteola]|uniref:histidine kinase n=1 Tax=Friedmanniella luteola TaxID=546871 RepID=A0A1H1TES3_9ACTN|nr:ATP-binding protein [Friedmanniella luteola]SDS58688.1 Histidine kinase-, DNA gyrase B-, and HSP90-like ATPase [Friedmanniella luteola]
MGTPQRDRAVSVPGLVVRFSLAGLVVMVLLASVIAALAREAGQDQAIDAAQEVTAVTARGIAEPRLTAQLVDGDPEQLTAFNDAMQRYVLTGSLVRVKLWDADGRVVYSDESRLIGRRYPLGEEEREALVDQRGTDSEISDLTQEENEFERPFGKLLEVYTGVSSSDGEPLLFEAYFRYDAVAAAGQAQWRSYAPPALAALLLLQLVQIPFAWSLARRLQRQQQDRQRLLQHAVDASAAERRRIAGDLHDGVVQQLTGVTYALDAARLEGLDAERDAALVRETAVQLRSSTAALRSLLVDIYPPNLAEEGLPAALTELAEGLQNAGVRVALDVESAADLTPEVSSVLFRSAQEVLRNVVAHSRAQRVEVQARSDGQTAVLVVDDDGRGFDQADLEEQRAAGHLGLRALGDLVARAGGRLEVTSAPGQGTRAEVSVPLR